MNRFITASVVLIGTVIGYLLGRSKQDPTKEESMWIPVSHGKRQMHVEQVGERVVFYVDVNDLPPDEAQAYIKKVKEMHTNLNHDQN